MSRWRAVAVAGAGSALVLLVASIAPARQTSREMPPQLSTDLPVEEAYRAIPHRRTVFRFERSSIAEPEREYLKAMFELIDRGVVLRVSAYRSFTRQDPDRDDLLADLVLLSDFVETRVSPPDALRGYHALVVSALKEQTAFFSEWKDLGSGFPYGARGRIGRNPRVQASSRALRAAYGILMRRYGAAEDPENRDAFFDYHCALDFL
jgi:hypothetical protein